MEFHPQQIQIQTTHFCDMTTVSKETLISQIHASAGRLVLATTGGGSSAMSELLGIAGASRTMIEGLAPYSAGALNDFLGGAPDQYCCESTARSMAMASFLRAIELEPDEPRTLLGVGCTASLASDRPKQGAHRVHVTVQTASQTCSASLELEKGARSRAGEEAVCSALILNQIAESLERDGNTSVGRVDSLLKRDEEIAVQSVTAPEDWTRLLIGEVSRVIANSENRAPDQLIFPGSFHPIHHGHRLMLDVASKVSQSPGALEISILNVDKPPLDFLEITARLEQISDCPVWLTRAPTFVEKAAIFPGATFVVGADTIGRVGDSVYYGGDSRRAEQAVSAIASAGCRFLVFGRLVEGRFCGLDEFVLSPTLRAICEEVPETEFREDVSSTALREAEE